MDRKCPLAFPASSLLPAMVLDAVTLDAQTSQKKLFRIGSLKAYHSGDLAAWDIDGKLPFFGRLDNQVKLRGLRVELDEVEAAINSYEGVKSSIVQVRGKDDSQFLCGFLPRITQLTLTVSLLI